MEDNNKNKKFYIFPVIYVLSAYLALLSLLAGGKIPLLNFLAVTPFISGILNIVMCIRWCKPGYLNIMLGSAALVKYCLIPFFIIGGLLVAGSFISGFIIPVPPIFMIGTLLAFIFCVAGWLVLAFGSPYTISYLVLSQREGRTSKGMAAFHIILQFFFTLDVIDVICLSFKARRNIKSTIAVIVLLVILVITLAALILFILFQIGLQTVLS